MTSETCEICGQEGFHGEAEVKTHMLLDHEENSGACPMCDLAHVTVEELTYHMNTAHRHILSPAQVGKVGSHGDPTNRHTPHLQPGNIVIAEEVQEENSLIYIEDYFGKSLNPRMQNGQSVDLHKEDMQCVDNADIALETEEDAKLNHIKKDVEYEGTSKCSMGSNSTSGDLFADSSVSASICDHEKENSQREIEKDCLIVDESKESLSERKVIRLQAGRTGPDKDLPQDQKQNERKRGRKERDVRPKDTCPPQRPQPEERRTSHQSLDTQASSRSGNDSVISETSSPFRKLFRTLTGRADESESDGKKEQSGIWVDLTNDSEPDLLDDDAIMLIEDAVPADEIQWEDIPSTSSASNPCSTSTPAKTKSKYRSKSGNNTNPKTESPNKPTLLSLSQSSKNVHSPILCPICGLGSYDPEFLMNHINEEHPEGAVGGSNTSDGALEAGAIGGEDISCPVCGLVGLQADELNAHVEGHFSEGPVSGQVNTSHRRPNEVTDMDRRLAEQLAEDEKQELKKKEEEEFKKLQALYGTDGHGNLRRQSERNTSKAVWRGEISPFEYHQQQLALKEALATGVDSGQSRTSDIIPRLVDYYNNKVHGVSFARFSSDLDHFSSSMGDSGWGCGYRNIQMMLSALVDDPRFTQVVFNGRKDIPSIPRIQLLIEDAWSKGFDAQGRDQLNGKVHNTRKWIGATEVVAMFSALRIKCRLFDFHAPSGQNGTHPRLFAWIRDYFGKPPILSMDNNVRSNKLPLYLQHEGHSRTIVGYDTMKDKSTRILLFDPSLRKNDANALRRGEITGHSLKPVRKTLSQMKAKQYQIVCIEGIISSDREYEKQGVDIATHIAAMKKDHKNYLRDNMTQGV